MSTTAANSLYDSYTVGGGYICGYCNMWVTYGTMHNCGNYWKTPAYWATWPQVTQADFDSLTARVAELEAEIKRLRRPRPRR